MRAQPTIRCVDCLGTARLLSHEPEEGWEPGDVVAYRCPDCGERFDVELTDLDDARGD
jgi:DNA-directed RNA polymerase subunit RPC12/RpoP